MEETGNIIFYKDDTNNTQIEVRLEDETVWLTQAHMQGLFRQTKQNISLHINNIFNEGELARDSTVKDSLTVREEGGRKVKRKVEYYSLDVIISVGYRVKSKQGTQFRIWANIILKDYHSFSDGNKRIAAFLFVWFLEKNGILYRPDGSKKIADNALVALTLMIAESKPEEKEMMIKVVVNLINLKN